MKELPLFQTHGCGSCRYWQKQYDAEIKRGDEPQDIDVGMSWGHCHRFPPVLSDASEPGKCDSWSHPVTFADDTCGEFQTTSLEWFWY